LDVVRLQDFHVPISSWKNNSQAQFGEDIYAYENYFYGLHNGLVLETGCGDFSASLFFERAVHWKAIHIESDPRIFKKLKQTRSNQINIHGAICSQPKIVHFVASNTKQAVGIYEHMSPSMIDTWHSDLKTNPLRMAALPEVSAQSS
jgi:hypothetical protein